MDRLQQSAFGFERASVLLTVNCLWVYKRCFELERKPFQTLPDLGVLPTTALGLPLLRDDGIVRSTSSPVWGSSPTLASFGHLRRSSPTQTAVSCRPRSRLSKKRDGEFRTSSNELRKKKTHSLFRAGVLYPPCALKWPGQLLKTPMPRSYAPGSWYASKDFLHADNTNILAQQIVKIFSPEISPCFGLLFWFCCFELSSALLSFISLLHLELAICWL